MKIETGQTLLMIGDSITDAGRARPVGERAFGGLGQGYVCYVDALLGAVYPDRQIRVINMGVSGNTVRDLKARWQSDVLELRPDWLSIMIGINDVWRQFDAPLNPTLHVYAEEYEETLEELVVQTKPLLRGLVLMTPFYIEPNREDAMRAMMDRYGAIVRGIAEKHGAYFVDTQAAFDEVMRYSYPASIAWDRVHPNPLGHMVLARAFLQAVDFRW